MCGTEGGHTRGDTVHRYRYEKSRQAYREAATSISTTIAHHAWDTGPLAYTGRRSPPPTSTGGWLAGGSRRQAQCSSAAIATSAQTTASGTSLKVRLKK